MTPREADVAFVLEGVEGVRAVHAFRNDPTLDFAIHVDSIKATVRAHAALLRVVTHVDCERVLFHREAMPARRAERATLLVLSPDERAAAKARVKHTPPPVLPTSPALAVYGTLPPAARGERRRILVHDADPAVARAVEAAAPNAERIVVEPRLGPAIHLAKTEPFDLVLCDVRFAFGPNGLLSVLHRFDAKGAERVTLVANPEELEFADGELRLLGHFCTFLERPLDVETLAFLVTHDALYVERWASPVPAARRLGDDDGATARELRAVPRARVLVVDDEGIDRETSDAASRIGVDLVVSHNAWHALDRLDEEWDGVVCSLAMKTPTGTPVYRMLWNGRPEMKSRFAFLVSPDAAPVSGTTRVITRPLSADAIAALLDAVGRR